MCLILLAWQSHPDYPLVVAANRDEFFARPTAPAGWWPDAPQVLAGRDLQGGGTWMGVTRNGRFAALTNYRDPDAFQEGMASRGELVAAFLRGDEAPEAYLQAVAQRLPDYNPFNLLVGDRHGLWYLGSREHAPPRPLAPGVYGLSNHLLDTPWPKVQRAKSALATALQALPERTPLFDLLRDRRHAPDAELPRTGVSLEWERLLSAAFVHSPDYGTRSATVLLLEHGGDALLEEVGFGPAMEQTGRVCERFRLI